jgi:FtsP/CotA-like multicopper oxidase with cupredoxin domain
MKRRLLVAVTLAGLLLVPLEIGAPAAAAPDIAFSLFGSRTPGWGLTNASMTSPGPPLQVSVGDNVTLSLKSLDGRNHNWYIDYNNNSVVDANETASSSPAFRSATTPVVWNFTVSNRTGTFHYRSRFNGDGSMWGNITIRQAGTGLFGLDTTTLVVVGLVVGGVAVVAILSARGRRRQVPPPPPEQ